MDLSVEGINDELDVLRWDAFNRFLNNMVAILILDAGKDVSIKFFNKCSLLVCKNMFECLTTVSFDLGK